MISSNRLYNLITISDFPSKRKNIFSKNFKKITQQNSPNISNKNEVIYESNISNNSSKIILGYDYDKTIIPTIHFSEDIFKLNTIDVLVDKYFNEYFPKTGLYAPILRYLIKFFSYKAISPPDIYLMSPLKKKNSGSDFNFPGLEAYLHVFFFLIQRLFRHHIVKEMIRSESDITNTTYFQIIIQLAIKFIGNYVYSNTITFPVGTSHHDISMKRFIYNGEQIAPLLFEILLANKINGIQTDLPNCGDIILFKEELPTREINVELIEVKSSLFSPQKGLYNKFLKTENIRVLSRTPGSTPINKTKSFIINKKNGIFLELVEVIETKNLKLKARKIERSDNIITMPIKNSFIIDKGTIDIEIKNYDLEIIINNLTQILIDIGILKILGQTNTEKENNFNVACQILKYQTFTFFSIRKDQSNSFNALFKKIRYENAIYFWTKLFNAKDKTNQASKITDLASYYNEPESVIQQILNDTMTEKNRSSSSLHYNLQKNLVEIAIKKIDSLKKEKAKETIFIEAVSRNNKSIFKNYIANELRKKPEEIEDILNFYNNYKNKNKLNENKLKQEYINGFPSWYSNLWNQYHILSQENKKNEKKLNRYFLLIFNYFNSRSKLLYRFTDFQQKKSYLQKLLNNNEFPPSSNYLKRNREKDKQNNKPSKKI